MLIPWHGNVTKCYITGDCDELFNLSVPVARLGGNPDQHWSCSRIFSRVMADYSDFVVVGDWSVFGFTFKVTCTNKFVSPFRGILHCPRIIPPCKNVHLHITQGLYTDIPAVVHCL